MTVTKRFCIFHRSILRGRPGNVTVPADSRIAKVFGQQESAFFFDAIRSTLGVIK
jgi:hypothetical protein